MITLNDEGQLLSSLSSKVNRIDLGCDSYRVFIYKLIRYFVKEKPDVIITSVYATGMAAILSKIVSRSRVKVIIGAHNLLSAKIRHPDNFKDKYVLKYIFPFLLKFSDHVVCVSNGVKSDFILLTKIKKNKITTIYNPVVNDSINYKKNERITNSIFNNIDKDCKIVISVGRIVPQKGYDTLLKAFNIVSKAINANLVIIGDGPEKEKLDKMTKDLGIKSKVFFLGFDPNPIKYISHSDLFVMSSKWEGFGNVIVEAMACGCQVVSTDCNSGPYEILDGGRFGVLAETNNPDDLARKIIHSLNGLSAINKDVLMRRSMDFDTSTSVNKYRSLINSLN